MDNFKYIENIKNGVGEIRVYDEIGLKIRNGKEYGVSGSNFASEMAYLQDNCDKIHIRFNSEGGSVLDGYSIYSSIINSKVPTKSFIDGLAASTAGWCALSANEVAIADMASLMVHGASGSDDKELINMVNSSIAKMLSNRTGMSEDETKELMNKETFYSAFVKNDRETLLNKKIVDEVVSTGKTVKFKKNEGLSNIAQIYNKLINKETMSSKINTLLKISNGADESEQEAAIVKLNNELTETSAKLTEATTKLAALEAEKAKAEQEAATALKNKSEALAASLVKEGKLKQEEVDATVKALVNNFDFTSNLLSKLSNGKESKKPFDFKNVKGEDGEDRSKWNYKEWEKKDLNGLINMRANEPEQFNELLKTLK